MTETPPVPAFIGVGSNLSGPREQVERAIRALGELPASRLGARSSQYRSSPLAGMRQPDYINAVARLDTALTPRELLAALQAIESQLGRLRDAERWGPRVIDLDLLVYGDRRIDEDRLTVPHPGIASRNFVLLPLMEIAADLVIPGLGPLASLSIDESEPRIERLATELPG